MNPTTNVSASPAMARLARKAGLALTLAIMTGAGLQGCTAALARPVQARPAQLQRAHQPTTQPRTIVLVHGAWMGAWAWEGVTAALRQQGDEVLVLDLPGHGDDATPLDKVSLDAYAKAVIQTIGTRDHVTLVGHSLAGVVISAVAEAIPTQLDRLVYVAAYMPRTGESLYALAQQDKESHTGRYWVQSDPEHYSPATVKDEGLRDVFCADCTDAQLAALAKRQRPEAVPPMATPVTLTPARYGSVPRDYVETTQDHCVSTTLQEAMIAHTPVQRVIKLASSHSPFFSHPQALADAIAPR